MHTQMSQPPPKSLQTLLDIGIFRLVPDHVVKSSPAALETNSPMAVAGVLSEGIVPSENDTNAAPKRQQPPLFWKAIGFCLKNRFTSSSSLYDDRRALFFGEPNQAGILDGRLCPQEVTNYQLFSYGDTMQRENESSSVGLARQALIEAKHDKDLAWEKSRLAFSQHSRTRESQMDSSLIGHAEADNSYQSTWEAENKAEKAFAELRSPALSSASAMLDMIRLADMRLEPQAGNNMPVIAVDEDWLERGIRDQTKTIAELVDPKLIYYRPFYSLSHYEMTTDYWIKSIGASSEILRDGPYMVPLAGVWDRQWSDLGHPLLDSFQPHETLSDDQKQFINSLSATLTFLQKPYSGALDRGLWDVTNFRDKFKLHPNAPSVIKKPICKTSTLIMAWGIEIEITIPEVVLWSEAKNSTLAVMDLPLKSVGGDGNKLVFSSGGDGIPVLLGALADIV
ncbi:hypothetical protein KAF25_003900 [Fusarium avenaceum]|uniref:Uncharacterized protein n=1 Tax=Fusarium avenaceum TaxID=40199 RepID=A0A9P7GW98_9HYPO|nr:hypothetical protein KAF25_003900 [Fusarium avenaceum]